MSNKIAAVVGIGPGLGRSVALRFAREGFSVALMARSAKHLSPVAEEVKRCGSQTLSLEMDAADEGNVEAAFSKVREDLGSPDVLVYNAGAFKMGSILDVDGKTFEQCWAANCAGAFHTARQVLPRMVEAGQGTILLTGATAALRGGAGFSCLAVGKFGLRALGQSMAREFGPKGVHVAHVIVDGQIDTPRMREMSPERDTHTLLDPDSIAETYWQLHQQPSTTWTLEMDLRPAVEKF